MSNAIEIPQLNQVLAKMKSAADFSFLGGVLMSAGVYIKGAIAQYPPSRSVPGRYSLRTRRPMGWYKRGTGWMSPIVRKGRAVGYKNYRATSETLGRKWTVAQHGALEVVVGNNVGYGPYVQSRVRVGGKGPQSRLMKAYGWPTVEDVAEQETGYVVRRVDQELEKRFGK